MNVSDEPLAEIIFDRKISRIIRELGDRTIAQLIREHCARTMTRTSFEARADEYLSRLTPAMVELAGGNRFPHPPIHVAPSVETTPDPNEGL
jgi:hypothetical protein